MSFGQKYTMGNETTPKYMMMTSMKDKGGGYDKAEAVKKVKDYNQIRNHVMASKDETMHNVSQVVSNLKKPLPRGNLRKK